MALGTLTTDNDGLAAVNIEAPAVNPSPTGLFAATAWQPADGPPRWLDNGIIIRQKNFTGLQAAGIWAADWCANPDDLTDDDIKDGFRLANLEKFDPYVVWGYDDCDLTKPSQAEVRANSAQNLRLTEQSLVEREFAARLLDDAGTPETATDIVDAVSQLEAELAEEGQVGVIHVSAKWAAYLVSAQIARRDGSAYRSPLGHLYVFGGGYVQGLGDTLVATSPVLGMQTAAETREAIKAEHNLFVAITERAVVLGYEYAYTAVTVA